MTSLKDLLTKVRNQQNPVAEGEEAGDTADTAYPQDPELDSDSDIDSGIDQDIMCYFLNEDGTCSDGCSCEEVEVTAQCPFMQEGNYDDCCCFEEAEYEDDDSDDEDA